MRSGLLITLTVVATVAVPGTEAVPPEATGAQAPPAASGPAPDAVTAAKAFQFDPALKVELFAAEPQLQNPVAFSPDTQGRWFISETYRQEKGVEDNRAHANWLNDDIAARTIEDRLAMMHKFYPDPAKFAAKFTKEEERITLLEDTDRNGVADKSTVYADGFREPLDGTAAGILARGQEVWWSNIPSLWRFADPNGDGKAETKEKLLTGFGVKFAYRGHDMHGLRFGPDGKLYFSIGDRGINVTSKEGRRSEQPDTGCVMRCNPDGTEFEVFAIGLRNPQELAFNELGDLFTGDNNSDSGDRARFLQIVEGGDCGWRTTFQYLPDRGPWNREKLWDEKAAPNAKYLIPPIANLADGPAGLTYNPGTGLSAKNYGNFFLSDFRGGASASVVHEIAIELKGAWHALKERRDFVKGVLTTDVEFGNDGALYVLDWVESWGGANKGRIYKFSDSRGNGALIAETKKLIEEGMSARPPEELIKLLAHADSRVRQAAQFELAGKGPAAGAALAKAAQNGTTLLARLHAVWALGQIGQKDPKTVAALLPLLADPEGEVRAQAAKVLGERHFAPAGEPLVSLLKDASGRARFQAALALGKLAHPAALDPLCAALAENADADPILRHGAVMGLAGCAKPEQLAAKSTDGNAAVRIGAVLALRRQRHPLIAEFLKDADEGVVLEAARGIHDDRINSALPALASVLENPKLKNPRILERAVNAAYRLGGSANATALAAFAAQTAAPDESRQDALDALALWANPNPKDRLLNLWRPLPQRPAADATAAISARLPALLKDPSPGVQEMAANVATKLSITAAGPSLAELAMNDKAAPPARLAALQALQTLKDSQIAPAAKAAMTAGNARLRAAGLKALASADAASAVKVIAEVIERGSPREKQGAVLALKEIDKPEARTVIAGLMEKLIAGQCVPEIQLDVYETAKKFGLQDQVQKFKAGLPANDPLANYKLSLAGGDVRRGRAIFREKAEVSCLRCHQCEIGDSQVGPDLTKIGALRDRLYLLESIVFPNKTVTPGFQTVNILRKDGTAVVGRLLAEDPQHLRVETLDAQAKPTAVTVPLAEIKERLTAPSPMPENIRDILSRAELRDLIEYLATRK